MTIRWARGALIILLLLVSRGVWANPPDGVPYVIQEKDTLSLIAERFYSTSDATQALYNYNWQAFSDAYDRARSGIPGFDSVARPKGLNVIFPNTAIVLPSELTSMHGVVYKRSGVPEDDAIKKGSDAEAARLKAEREAAEKANAEKVAAKKPTRPLKEIPTEDLRLKDLNDHLRKQKPKWIIASRANAPQGSRRTMATSTDAKREKIPRWFEAPSNGVQQCAKRVCEQYRSLCYYECVAVAKRFSDARLSCDILPNDLPYTLNADSREDCAANLDD